MGRFLVSSLGFLVSGFQFSRFWFLSFSFPVLKYQKLKPVEAEKECVEKPKPEK